MPYSTILITGASSGIGAALAQRYARAGRTLLLWGRDAARLEAVADGCRALGADCRVQAFDLRDTPDLIRRLSACDVQTPIDLVIFNAGVGGSVPDDALAEAPEAALMTAEVNFVAPVVGASLIAGAMARRGRGRIVLVSSVAEFFPLPMAPAYAGSKAGLAMFAQSLSLRMEPHGVGVTLVSPGFIDTPMSSGITQPKPFIITADRAGAIIVKKVDAGARQVILPWQYAVAVHLLRLLPRVLVRAMMRSV